jgi:hypothetical protein
MFFSIKLFLQKDLRKVKTRYSWLSSLVKNLYDDAPDRNILSEEIKTLAYHHIFCVLIYVYDEDSPLWRMTTKIKSCKKATY